MTVFPMTAAQFFDGLAIQSMTMWPEQPQSVTRDRNGVVQTFGRGAAVWRGRVQLVPDLHRDAAAIEALLDVAARPGASFLAHDTRFDGPAADPTGAALAGRTVTVHAVGADNLSLALAGLPAGFQITRGDRVGVTWGANPVRYGLWRFHGAGVADPDGQTPLIAVTTFLADAVGPGDAVSLVRPPVKAVLDGLTYGAGLVAYTEAAAFDFIQTYG